MLRKQSYGKKICNTILPRRIVLQIIIIYLSDLFNHQIMQKNKYFLRIFYQA